MIILSWSSIIELHPEGMSVVAQQRFMISTTLAAELVGLRTIDGPYMLASEFLPHSASYV